MLQTISADGNSSSITAAHKIHVHLSGTFGSGTAKLQFLDEGGTWRDINGAAWTTAADEIVELGKSQYKLRINVSGSSSPALVVNLRA